MCCLGGESDVFSVLTFSVSSLSLFCVSPFGNSLLSAVCLCHFVLLLSCCIYRCSVFRSPGAAATMDGAFTKHTIKSAAVSGEHPPERFRSEVQRSRVRA